MNDDLMFEYLLQMGAMRPEELEMLRKQKMVESLRDKSQATPEGQMVSGHYVAPSWTQYAANAMSAYNATKQQQDLDKQMREMNDRQRQMLEDLRKRKNMGAQPIGGSMTMDPYGNVPKYGGYA